MSDRTTRSGCDLGGLHYVEIPLVKEILYEQTKITIVIFCPATVIFFILF